MGMDLAEGKRGIGFSSAFWYDVLQLGLEYGWEPMGVGPPAGFASTERRPGRPGVLML